MTVSYEEGLANYFGLRRRCDEGNNVVLSVRAGGNVGQLLSSEIITSVCRPCPDKGKATSPRSLVGKIVADTAESTNLCMRGNPKRENREIPSAPRLRDGVRGRSANLSEGKAEMNADGKSDDFILLTTRANKTATAAAESVEGRKSPKGSISKLSPMFRTLSRTQHQLEWHGNHDWYQRVRAGIV